MKSRKYNPNKCEASGAKLVGRDWYTVTYKDGQTICNCCGKVINLRTLHGVEYIPTHNVPKETKA